MGVVFLGGAGFSFHIRLIDNALNNREHHLLNVICPRLDCKGCSQLLQLGKRSRINTDVKKMKYEKGKEKERKYQMGNGIQVPKNSPVFFNLAAKCQQLQNQVNKLRQT